MPFPSKAKFLHLSFIFFCALPACHSDTREESDTIDPSDTITKIDIPIQELPIEMGLFHAGTIKDREELYRLLHYPHESTIFDTLSQNRSASFRPHEVLPKLHSWFTEGYGLKKIIRLSSYEIIELNPIPDIVLKQLAEVTFSADFNSGFALLQHATWSTIAQNQKNGIRFGIISKSPTLVSGVYFPRALLIGIDVLSPIGVLKHELRHHQQFTQRPISPNGSASKLSSACVAKIDRYLKELDANTEEFSDWQGAVRDLRVLPSLTEDIQGLLKSHTLYLLENLSGFFGYPLSEAGILLNEKECSEDFNNATLKISQFLGSESLTLGRHSMLSLDRGRAILMHLKIQSAESEGLLDRIPFYQQSLEEIRTKVDQIKQATEEQLAKLPNERKAFIKNTFNALDESLKSELCSRTLAFKMIADCE